MRNSKCIRSAISNNSGFTLVELMVVVAIIGILAAIAIPNFQKYQAKSRQTEAKLALASIYTAEKSYAVENSTFSQCLGDIGYEPTGSVIYYSAGWKGTAAGCGTGGASACNITFGGGVAGAACTMPGGLPPNTAYSVLDGAYTGNTAAINANIAISKAPPNVNFTAFAGGAAAVCNTGAVGCLNATTFYVEAVGNVSAASANPWDIWAMTDLKALSNPQPGI